MALRVVLFDAMVGGHHLEYASHLIRYLRGQGDQVTLVTWGPDPLLEAMAPSDRPTEIRFVTRGQQPFGGHLVQRIAGLVRGLRHCFRVADEQEADVVHHLYLDRSELPLMFAAPRQLDSRSWRLFATLFWPYFVSAPGQPNPLSKRVYYRANHSALRQLVVARRLTNVFVHSDRIKRLLVESYGDDSLASRLVLVPDPSEAPRSSDVDAARVRLNLPLQDPMVLFFGGLRWDKGPDVLLESVSRLTGDWFLVLAGPPEDIGSAEVERCRSRLREPDRLIARLELVPNSEVQDYFAAADVVVLPYRRIFKGTSGVLQRAAAAGKPVVAADVGDVGPTVRDKGLGLLVNPESPVELVAALERFLRTRSSVSEEVRPRALQYADESDWRILGSIVRDAYHVGLQGERR